MKKILFLMVALVCFLMVLFIWLKPVYDLVKLTGIEEFRSMKFVGYDYDPPVRFFFSDRSLVWFFECEPNEIKEIIQKYNICESKDTADSNSSYFYALFQCAKKHLDTDEIIEDARCAIQGETATDFLYMPDKKLLVVHKIYLKSQGLNELDELRKWQERGRK